MAERKKIRTIMLILDVETVSGFVIGSIAGIIVVCSVERDGELINRCH
jgi:hypothetical protein